MEHFANYDRRMEPPDDDHTAECIGCGYVKDLDDMARKTPDGWWCKECQELDEIVSDAVEDCAE